MEAGSLPFLRLRLLPVPEVFDALRAVPAQLLAVYAQVNALPAFAREHQTTAQITATTTGR